MGLRARRGPGETAGVVGTPAARDPGADDRLEQRLLEAYKRYDRAFKAAGPRCPPGSEAGIELARARMDLVLQLQLGEDPIDDHVLLQLTRDAEQLLRNTKALESDDPESS
ncbi:MAG: hypothetical protein JWO22_2598 [Frankiales bacterium]|nr:hypothetical protein [Frankiales bacterium]